METSSTVEKLLKQAEQADKDNVVKEQEVQQWREALNRIAESADGQLLFDKMLKYMYLFSPLDGINPQSNIEINGRRSFYLKHIRPYLTNSNKTKVEK